jgi:hypothetical protein
LRCIAHTALGTANARLCKHLPPAEIPHCDKLHCMFLLVQRYGIAHPWLRWHLPPAEIPHCVKLHCMLLSRHAAAAVVAQAAFARVSRLAALLICAVLLTCPPNISGCHDNS